ncbi:hypothetical protein RCL1_007967 [Eukaryota sp. TZLM3-RCL]
MCLIESLYTSLSRFESITKRLQQEHLPLHESRAVLNVHLEDYPEMANYIVEDSSMVHSPAFESAVILVEKGDEASLTPVQKQAIECFKIPQYRPIVQLDPFLGTFENRIALKIQTRSLPSAYLDLSFIPFTSNEAERLFSTARRVLESRPALGGVNLCRQLKLYYNRSLWSRETINGLI